MTYDLNPHLHELAPGLWAALGYSGRGIAMATMMGRDLAARIAGPSDAALAFPLTALRSSRIRSIAKPLVGCLLNYYRALDAWDDTRRSRRSGTPGIVGGPPGSLNRSTLSSPRRADLHRSCVRFDRMKCPRCAHENVTRHISSIPWTVPDTHDELLESMADNRAIKRRW